MPARPTCPRALRGAFYALTCALLMLTLATPGAANAEFSFQFKWGANGGGGSFGSGDGEFQFPNDVAQSNGSVYVADSSNNRIQRFSEDAQFLGKWGANGGDGTSGIGDGEFTSPLGLDTDAAGNVYVADADNNRIQKFDSSGTFISKWGANGGDGSSGIADGEFASPFWVAVDRHNDFVYVADTGNARVQRFGLDGTYAGQFPAGLPSDSGPSLPAGITTDSQGNVYITDLGRNRVIKFDPAGQGLTSWGTLGAGLGEFGGPFGIRADADDNIYVADFGNNRVQQFDSNGGFEDLLGSVGSGDGEMQGPTGVALDSDSHVYVADRGNHRVQRFEKLSNSSEVSISGSTLLVRAHEGVANDVAVSLANDAYAVTDASAPLKPAAPCTKTAADTVSCPAGGINLIVVDALDGDDNVDVIAPTASQLLGGGGADTLSGGAGADAISGDGSLGSSPGPPGDDALDGGGGNDQLDGGQGDDSLAGGSGDDRADYSAAPDGVTVDLSETGAQSTGAAGSDTLAEVENVNGSPGADVLTGSAVSNRIDAGAGDDRIEIRDTSSDSAGCGDGNDTVTADRTDTTASDCEIVSLPPLADTTPPLLTRLDSTVIWRRFGGGHFSYRLSEPAKVKFVITRPELHFGRECGRAWLCLLYIPVGTISAQGAEGHNRFSFSGKIGGVALRSGLYVLSAYPTDAAGNEGRPDSTPMAVIG